MDVDTLCDLLERHLGFQSHPAYFNLKVVLQSLLGNGIGELIPLYHQQSGSKDGKVVSAWLFVNDRFWRLTRTTEAGQPPKFTVAYEVLPLRFLKSFKFQCNTDRSGIFQPSVEVEFISITQPVTFEPFSREDRENFLSFVSKVQVAI